MTLLAHGVSAADLFTAGEQAHWDRALGALNVTDADLGFAKDHGEPKLALGWIRSALHDPEALLRAGEALWAAAQDASGTSLWVTTAALLEVGETPKMEAPTPEARDTWEGLNPELAEALSHFMDAARRADHLLDRAYGQLKPEERSYLAAAALAGVFNAEDEEATRAVLLAAGMGQGELAAVLAEGRQLDATPAAEHLLELVGRIDRAAVLEAGHLFQRAVLELTARARGITQWPSGNILLVTDLGKVRIASPGDDNYSDRALLILSPGGRNTYHGEAGVANGLRGQRLAAVIDLDGPDIYRSSGLLSAGSALFGVSVVVDGAGDDTWRASYAGQGFGCYGVAWVEDLAGDDDYEARALAQGASVLGVGVLQDHAGNDVYDVGQQGQACAVLPGLAALIDHAGTDRYFAGGREPDYERNDDRFLSLAQGFAIGMRPFAGGGVALLADLGGNDTYVADIYGQGVSYYYSAAFLFDGSGHDGYTVYQYGQGAGIHLSLGLLVDLSGDDTYRGGILVQGAAHDFAVGGLLDRTGRDTYVADHDAQGHGMNNALAWLLDGAGDDVYTARDTSNAQGVGNTGGERECGSLGLLLDLGGDDAYSCAVSNGVPRLRPLYGIVYDVDAEAKP
jgi:hypothetical protein